MVKYPLLKCMENRTKRSKMTIVNSSAKVTHLYSYISPLNLYFIQHKYFCDYIAGSKKQ